MVEVGGVVREVRLEDIKPAVAVVVGHSKSHAGLFVTVIVVGATGDHRDICKSAVVIVLEHHARF